MLLRRNFKVEEIVIYNFNIKSQEMELLFRGRKIPAAYRPYPKLWRLRDKERKTETIIISL
ncbi:MAG: hypothetical protein KKE16_04420 [Firmicutes bacterium]|nr:hypothetical protein [Bacillota bacterium]